MKNSLSLTNDSVFMNRCIELAQNGLGNTYPNPLVGSVIVYKGRIIGEGWHQKAGEAHAEVNAVNSVKDKSVLKEATLYVNLEPCCHFGKTPPCAALIIQQQIKRVVVGSLDPNPLVAGKGVAQLQAAGVEVTTDVLTEECEWLNRRFFSYHRHKRPWIILKWAQSQDGYLSPEHRENVAPVWITSEASRQLVHQWRSEEQGIVVGVQTIVDDNPSLTTRLVKGKSPTRFVIDPKGRIPKRAQVLKSEANTTIISCNKELEAPSNVSLTVASESENLIEKLLKTAYEQGLQSLIIEGGAFTLQQFIKQNLWDEARIFTGMAVFNNGTKAPELELTPVARYKCEEDEILIGIPKRQLV